MFAEMDGNNHVQQFTANPGDTLTWSVDHRGRRGADEITILMGPVGAATVQDVVTSPSTAWATHTGTYTVPPGVSSLEIIITPSDASDGDIDSSNFLDNVIVTR